MMKRWVKLLAAAVLSLVCVGVAAAVMLQPKPVQAEPVRQGALSEQVREQGVLVPVESRTILADTSGIVASVALQVGRPIKAGETLLTLDTTALRKELESRIASLKLQQSAIYSGNSSTQAEIALRREQLAAQLTTARQEHDRLFGKGGSAETLREIAQRRYEQAREDYRRAKDDFDEDYGAGRAELSALRQQVSVARENLVLAQNQSSESTRDYYLELIASCEAQLAALDGSDSYAGGSAYASAEQLQLTIDRLTEQLERGAITAPSDGIGWQVLVEQGAFVSENQPVAVLYSGEQMQLEARLLAADALALQIGEQVHCLYADGTETTAEVRFISPVAEQVLSTIGLSESRCTVELWPRALPERVGAGHQVDLEFTFVAAQDVLSVPAASILPHDQGSAVYRIEAGRAVLVPVETGLRRGGYVEIRSGLAPGDSVVRSPYDAGIKPGSRVAVTE